MKAHPPAHPPTHLVAPPGPVASTTVDMRLREEEKWKRWWIWALSFWGPPGLDT